MKIFLNIVNSFVRKKKKKKKITPHSNVGIERVFSLVEKNKSAGSDRNRLDIEGSLLSILAVKMERPESQEKCYCFKPSDELLNSAKKATYAYNESKGQH